MARLEISLLGNFRATLDGEPVTAFAYDNVDDCQTKVDNTGIRAYTYTVICCL